MMTFALQFYLQEVLWAKKPVFYVRQEDGQAGRRQSGDRQTDRQATDRQATSVLATGDLKIKLGFDCLCEVSLKSVLSVKVVL